MNVDMKMLKEIEAYDAFRLALEVSGKTEKEVAEEMGYEFSNCHRIFSFENYYTSYEKLPKMCEVLGNNIIVLWQIAQADKRLDKPCHEPVDCPTLLKDAADLFKETSDVGKEAAEAIKDDKLEAHELRKVIRELGEVQEKVFSMIGKLRQTERSLAKMLKATKA